MRSKKEIEKQLANAERELFDISTNKIKGSWRRTKGYVDALGWVLEEE